MRMLLLAGLMALLAAAPAAARPHTPVIVNGDEHGNTIRFDTDGNAIDAHDGEIRRYEGRYWLYGTSYGCGYVRLMRPATPWCGYRSYSSPDLVHWEDEGPLFDATTDAWQARCNSLTLSCYRPHVAYNAATRRYVLWMNLYDVPDGYHVFTSRRPEGPFTEVGTPTMHFKQGGDMDLFVDRDGTGYIAYTLFGPGGYDEAVEKLDPTYTTGTGEAVRLGLRSTEAPSLFERRGTYYMTISDPNCAYCDGTGASYLTAPTPLGPWTGDMRSDAPIVDGRLQLAGRGAIARGGEAWTDYGVEMTIVPRQTGTGSAGSYAQSGWFFRAADERNGYAWLIGNYPHPGAAGGSLTKVVYVDGRPRVTIVRLPFPIVAGREYRIRTEASGTTIRTWIDGTLVDTTTDATYAGGSIGLRETGTESGLFDDVRVTAPDGTVLFEEDFSSGDLSRWRGLEPRLRGFEISPDACGGQPADVAELPGRDGPLYLFQSDRWNSGDQNEALATHYWEPLRFAGDGAIEPLRCDTRFELPLEGASRGRDERPQRMDQTSGTEGFRAVGDLSGAVQRAQTFTAGRSGMVVRLALTAYQDDHPDGPLVLRLTELMPEGTPGAVLSQRTIPAELTRWAPSEVTIDTAGRVKAGRRYAIVAAAPAAGGGHYGVAAAEGDVYGRGEALVSRDGGATWSAEPGRDLRFETSVRRG
jgi:Glycosyl hydrolases family 43